MSVASSNTNEMGGMFEINATAAPEPQGRRTGDTDCSRKSQRIQADGPPAEELARVKAKHRTSLLAGLTSPMQRNLVIALGLAQHNDPHHYQTLFTKYEQVTPAGYPARGASSTCPTTRWCWWWNRSEKAKKKV